MKDLLDLKDALKTASDKNLIQNFYVHRFYLDIDFYAKPEHRTTEYINKILSLREYIKSQYSEVQTADFMPLLNRLRLYGNFERIK